MAAAVDDDTNNSGVTAPVGQNTAAYSAAIRIAGRELSTMAYGESQAQCLLADSARGALHRF